MSSIPVCRERIKKGKRGSDRYVDVLPQCTAKTGETIPTARAVRIEMSKKSVTAATVCSASTMTLRRIHDRSVSSVYERFRRRHVHGDKVLFLYDSKECRYSGVGALSAGLTVLSVTVIARRIGLTVVGFSLERANR